MPCVDVVIEAFYVIAKAFVCNSFAFFVYEWLYYVATSRFALICFYVFLVVVVVFRKGH